MRNLSLQENLNNTLTSYYKNILRAKERKIIFRTNIIQQNINVIKNECTVLFKKYEDDSVSKLFFISIFLSHIANLDESQLFFRFIK